ncbi:MAG: TetR/AcrR family transcriptional regulator [Alphaproteobacteria bacterium]|nr:TetR/AcrR family transcriptional regulator [Alphaproteobacteria bacterium]
MSQTRRGERTRTALLDAATEELLAKDGDMALIEVARRAGVSAGAPYRHFASRSGLLVALVDRFYDAWEAEAYHPGLEEVSEDWWAREQERIRRTVAFHYGHPLGVIMQQRLLGDAEAVRRQRLRTDRHVRGAVKNLRRGQAQGRVPATLDPELAGALIMGGVSQVLRSALGQVPAMDEARVVDTLRDLTRALLGITERPPTRQRAP